MSVRLRQWKDQDGTMRERWTIDVNVKLPGHGKPVRVRDASPVNTRRGAEQYERQVRQQLLDGTFGKVATTEEQKVPTLGDFEARYMAHSELHNKPGSVTEKKSIFRNHLLPAFAKTPLDQIGRAEIDALAAKLIETGRSPKTTNNIVGVLHNVLAMAVEWKVITDAPKLRLLKATSHEDPIDDSEFLSREGADRLIAATAPEWRAMVTVAVNTGLRRGELRGLQWSDVRFEGQRIVVRHNVYRGKIGNPKGGKARVVPLNETALTALEGQRHELSPFVFANPDGSYLKSDACRKAIEAAGKAAGLEGVGWHKLRHTFASHLVMAGASLAEVKELLGHSSLKTTMRYAHLSKAAMRSAVRLLDKCRNGTSTAQAA